MRAAAGAALLAAAALLLSGCGDDTDERELARCKANVTNAAQAAVLAKAFERGDLGTQAQVQSHFTPKDRIFDDQGRMLPYSKLHGLTRGRFDEYRASEAIPGNVQSELAAARARAEDAGYPGCD